MINYIICIILCTNLYKKSTHFFTIYCMENTLYILNTQLMCIFRVCKSIFSCTKYCILFTYKKISWCCLNSKYHISTREDEHHILYKDNPRCPILTLLNSLNNGLIEDSSMNGNVMMIKLYFILNKKLVLLRFSKLCYPLGHLIKKIMRLWLQDDYWTKTGQFCPVIVL
jgi:hypothetical protein